MVTRKIVLKEAISCSLVSNKLEASNYKLFMNTMISCFIPTDARLERRMLAKGMILNHFEMCNLVGCFCKKDVIYDCKKSKNVMIQKSKESGFHFKCYIKEVLQVNNVPK